MLDKNIRPQIIELLANNYVYVDPTEEEDVDLSLYFEDSIQFISFVISVEDFFDIELPDELLLFDNFRYLSSICSIIESLMQKT